MVKSVKAQEATVQDERMRVVVPTDMSDPKNKTVEGTVNGEVFRVPRGVPVMLTLSQYEVLRASGRVQLY